MLANASPLNPIDVTVFKSSADLILLVACLSNANSKSSSEIPFPLSVTFIYDIPPFSISTTILLAPASIEFSIISFITDAGLSITSPAAILLIVKSSNKTMFPIFLHYLLEHLRILFFCSIILLYLIILAFFFQPILIIFYTFLYILIKTLSCNIFL